MSFALDEGTKKILRAYVEKNTPLPNNICKDCGGRVVRQADASVGRRRFYPSGGSCEECKREYRLARNAPKRDMNIATK